MRSGLLVKSGGKSCETMSMFNILGVVDEGVAGDEDIVKTGEEQSWLLDGTAEGVAGARTFFPGVMSQRSLPRLRG